MTTTPDELLMDEWNRTHPHEVEVHCEDCGEGLIVRFLDGEPCDENEMGCHCGGTLEVA